ncbi:MAG TPA: hypothetical protein H9761_00360 [Candidatus Eisenbergiella merdavium]|uniref:FeoB-associated Cys-rich membrane protein n=1 Tax=Candidatus Eisenbergiella merdavium TaxID=2838551 RepID=A0A9D2SMV0_9FIRM|nr:hypothetical protein [Candidatus Eisenbergiella merdavium]
MAAGIIFVIVIAISVFEIKKYAKRLAWDGCGDCCRQRKGKGGEGA